MGRTLKMHGKWVSTPMNCDPIKKEWVPVTEREKELFCIVSQMLGYAETDRLDDKSNLWRSLMIRARSALHE